MAKPGPAPTPTPILKARGSWRADDRDGEPTLPVLAEVPPVPPTCKGTARKLWIETATVMIDMQVLTASHLHRLEEYCLAREELLYLDAHVKKIRSKLLRSTNYPPVVAMRNNTRDAVQRMAAQLGLSPASQTRLRVQPTKDQEQAADTKSRFFKGA